ncbi:MAG: hypothetical protein ACFE0O_00785 [Opitutales bacterium]
MLPNTQNAPAPDNAVILFDGSSLDGWTGKNGDPAGWEIEDGALKVVPCAPLRGCRG